MFGLFVSEAVFSLFVVGLFFLEVGEYAVDVFVVFEHLLVVAAALFVGTSADMFAHDAVYVPLPLFLLLTLEYFPELQQEDHVFVVLFIAPVRSPIVFLRGRALLQTKQDFLRPEHPRLYFPEGVLVAALI